MSDERRVSEVEARRGFYPFVVGDNVTTTQAGGVLYLAQGDLSMTQSGGRTVIAGGDVSMSQGGAQLLIAGGDVSVREGGAGVAMAKTLNFDRSYVGIAVGREVSIGNDSKVLLGDRQAVLLGVGLGAVCGLVCWMVGRRRR